MEAAEKEEKNPGYLLAVFTNKCPRCRQGHLYQEANPYKLSKVTAMNEVCLECGQPTDLEVGFYYGTSYVSYTIAIIVCALSFVLWWLLIGFSFSDSRFFYWMGFNAFLLIAIQPLLMRLSRTLWLSWFVKYDPNWKSNKIKDLERIVTGQMNNW